MLYDAEPAADDAEGQALLARFKGRRLPMVDRVEIYRSSRRSSRAGWRSSTGSRLPDASPAEFVNLADARRQAGAQPGQAGHPALPGAARRRSPTRSSTWKTRWWAATRRTRSRCAAPSPGLDAEREIAMLRNGQAIAAQSPLLARTRLRPDFAARSATTTRPAKALLDLYGYVDRDGDGWREQPDGSPLVLELAHRSDQLAQFERAAGRTWPRSASARVQPPSGPRT